MNTNSREQPGNRLSEYRISIRRYDELKSLLVEVRDKVSRLADAAEKELLTPKEVCTILKISMRTYRRLIEKGILSQIRLDEGKRKYILRSEIDRLISEGKA